MEFIRQVGSIGGHKIGLYRCSYCNNLVEKRVSSVRKGMTKSCGCYSGKLISAKNTKHNLGRTKIYKIWHSMVSRCHNKNSQSFKNYGDRGIFVCDEWRNNIILFHSWCIDNGYKVGLQLDRIDNDKGYSQDNCRFVTARENMRNNRQTKLNIEIATNIKKMLSQGIKQKDIAKIYNIDASSVSNIKRGITWHD